MIRCLFEKSPVWLGWFMIVILLITVIAYLYVSILTGTSSLSLHQKLLSPEDSFEDEQVEAIRRDSLR